MFRLPNGEEQDFYIKLEGPAVAVFAITKDKQVILVKQFRPGPDEILNEIPGGYIDKNESIQQAAERELLEETGYKGTIKVINTAYDCAYSTMKRHCVVATDCKKVTDQRLDNTEFAEVILMPLNNFRDLLRSGQMTDLEIGYLSLDYLGLL